MSASADFLTAALDSLDTQMVGLQSRMVADAVALNAALVAFQNSAGNTAALDAATSRINATANLVSSLAAPSAVADPGQPAAVAALIPVDPAAGESGALMS